MLPSDTVAPSPVAAMVNANVLVVIVMLRPPAFDEPVRGMESFGQGTSVACDIRYFATSSLPRRTAYSAAVRPCDPRNCTCAEYFSIKSRAASIWSKQAARISGVSPAGSLELTLRPSSSKRSDTCCVLPRIAWTWSVGRPFSPGSYATCFKVSTASACCSSVITLRSFSARSRNVEITMKPRSVASARGVRPCASRAEMLIPFWTNCRTIRTSRHATAQ